MKETSDHYEFTTMVGNLNQNTKSISIINFAVSLISNSRHLVNFGHK